MIAYESAKPNEINAKTAGATMNKSAFRRPSASDTKPLSKLPNGCPINVKLAAQRNKHIQMKNQIFVKNVSNSDKKRLTQP